ncbi:MAG: hypothetical protein ACI4MK_02810 [Aristaeellaceae bacterium]
MKIVVNTPDIDMIQIRLRETAIDLERIRKEIEQIMSDLAQAWQGDDSRALQESFAGPGGLNEFSKRMVRGFLAFSDHLSDTYNTYESVLYSIAQAESAASKK